jgi:hypothetical protein
LVRAILMNSEDNVAALLENSRRHTHGEKAEAPNRILLTA